MVPPEVPTLSEILVQRIVITSVKSKQIFFQVCPGRAPANPPERKTYEIYGNPQPQVYPMKHGDSLSSYLFSGRCENSSNLRMEEIVCCPQSIDGNGVR